MMEVEHTKGYRISFWVDKTKSIQSGFVGTMMLINFLCRLLSWV